MIKGKISPKEDVVFQAIFGQIGCERITKSFLEAILKQKINEVDLSQNIVLRRQTVNDKLGVLDVLVKIDEKEICNIEMQIVQKENLIERILYYWSRLYMKQIKKGQKFEELEKTIIILIADFKMKGMEKQSYHSKWKIIESESEEKDLLTDKLEIDIIELPKIKGKDCQNDPLLDWLYFLDNPKSERVIKMMEEKEEIKEAVEKLDEIYDDETMEWIMLRREIAEIDEISQRDHARKEGLKEGLEEGMKQGLEEGIEEGIEKGLEKGRQEEKKEILKRLLKLNMNIEEIYEITGLDREQIERIKIEDNL